ncbi:hypothetical protein [Aminobacter niigataensis]|uniref:hypothetical protein n=1 Tax=Aminobacter niigataensis TaxID=83265 RepID=UPI0024CC9894|nr:hypothetical protein [Aminobacter niigataensis]CAI2936237.1 protein of unknown function [Aminobacter niigataensis]
MSEGPFCAGDYVLLRVQVTHCLNDGYLVVSTPNQPIVVHETDVSGAVEATRSPSALRVVAAE